MSSGMSNPAIPYYAMAKPNDLCCASCMKHKCIAYLSLLCCLQVPAIDSTLNGSTKRNFWRQLCPRFKERICQMLFYCLNHSVCKTCYSFTSWTHLPRCASYYYLLCVCSFEYCSERILTLVYISQNYGKNQSSTLSTAHYVPPLPALGHIWDVMLVWRKGNINKN